LLRFQEPQHPDESQALLDSLQPEETLSNTPSNAIILLESPANQPLVPYENGEGAESDDVTLYRASSEEEICDELSLLSLNEGPYELNGIIIVQEETLKLAESLLKITPQPTWSWGSSGTTKMSQPGETPSNFPTSKPPRVQKVKQAPIQRDYQPYDSLPHVQGQDPTSDSGGFAESRASATPQDPMQYLEKQEGIDQSSRLGYRVWESLQKQYGMPICNSCIDQKGCLYGIQSGRVVWFHFEP
jgi:hypothetical protein